MDPIILTCGRVRQTFDVPADRAGETCYCPYCGDLHHVPKVRTLRRRRMPVHVLRTAIRDITVLCTPAQIPEIQTTLSRRRSFKRAAMPKSERFHVPPLRIEGGRMLSPGDLQRQLGMGNGSANEGVDSILCDDLSCGRSRARSTASGLPGRRFATLSTRRERRQSGERQ